jgi:hypothetical protein
MRLDVSHVSHIHYQSPFQNPFYSVCFWRFHSGHVWITEDRVLRCMTSVCFLIKTYYIAVKSRYLIRILQGGTNANFEAVILTNVAVDDTNPAVELPVEIYMLILITRTANRLHVRPDFSQCLCALVNFCRGDCKNDDVVLHQVNRQIVTRTAL